MTITITPDVAFVPPRNAVAVSVTPGSVMSTVAIYRNDSTGRILLRSQPSPGFDSRTVYDYECPYGEAVTYDWAADYVAPGTDVFAETWASLAAWTTVGASWSVAGNRVLWGAADSLTASVLRAVTSGKYRIVFSAVPKGIWKIDFGGFYIDLLAQRLYIGASFVAFSPGTTTWTIDVTDTSVTLTTSVASYSVTGVALVTQVKFLGPVATYAFANTYGSSGSGNGQFQPGAGANGIAVDGSGNIFVADEGNNRIQKFNSAGVYQSQFGSSGTGNGQFNGPQGVAIDTLGNIWVADTQNNRIQKFNSAGTYQLQSGTAGSGNGQFSGPWGIVADSSNNVFVVDAGNHRVQKFNSSGVYQSQFGSSGSGDGQFSYPHGIALDGSGNIWIADRGNLRVQKFNSSGVYQSKFTTDRPEQLAFDTAGNLFVGSDLGSYRVQKYSTAGDLLQAIAPFGGTDGTADRVGGLAIGSSGDLWVGDQYPRLQRFTRSATSITPVTVTSYGTPSSIAEPSGPVTLEPAAGWLIHPGTPGLSFPLQLSGDTLPRAASIRNIAPVTNPSSATIHRILGTGQGVATTNGPRDDDELDLTVSIHTRAEELALKAMLADQTAILVNISPAKKVDLAYGFYQIEDTVDARLGQAPNMPFRSYVLPMVKVGSPAVTVQNSGWSWAALALARTAWSEVKTAYAAWAAVASNTPL